MTTKSVVGDLINFRGLVYSPRNDDGVIFLFGKVAHDLNMYVEEVKQGFPDCIARLGTELVAQRLFHRRKKRKPYCLNCFLQYQNKPDSSLAPCGSGCAGARFPV